MEVTTPLLQAVMYRKNTCHEMGVIPVAVEKRQYKSDMT